MQQKNPLHRYTPITKNADANESVIVPSLSRGCTMYVTMCYDAIPVKADINHPPSIENVIPNNIIIDVGNIPKGDRIG